MAEVNAVGKRDKIVSLPHTSFSTLPHHVYFPTDIMISRHLCSSLMVQICRPCNYLPNRANGSTVTMHVQFVLEQNVCYEMDYCSVSARLRFSILVFRPEGQIWNPVRRDTRIYVRRILNASRISKTQLNSCTISPS